MTETCAHLSRRGDRSPVRTHACSTRAWDDVARTSRVRGAAGVLTAALGAGLSVAVLVIFRRLAPDTGPIRRFLSANAFTVYVIHVYVIHLAILVGLALTLRDVTTPVIAKLGVLLFLAVPASWLLAAVVRTIPGVKKIL